MVGPEATFDDPYTRLFEGFSEFATEIGDSATSNWGIFLPEDLPGALRPDLEPLRVFRYSQSLEHFPDYLKVQEVSELDITFYQESVIQEATAPPIVKVSLMERQLPGVRKVFSICQTNGVTTILRELIFEAGPDSSAPNPVNKSASDVTFESLTGSEHIGGTDEIDTDDLALLTRVLASLQENNPQILLHSLYTKDITPRLAHIPQLPDNMSSERKTNSRHSNLS